MPTAQDYVVLTQRLAGLRERAAVLADQEFNKAKERALLQETLKAAGVNVDKPEEECARLEKLLNNTVAEAERIVNQFERDLTEAIAPRPAPPTPAKPAQPARPPQPPRVEEGELVDIDI